MKNHFLEAKEHEGKPVQYYFRLIKNNYITISVIALAGLLVSVLYIFLSTDSYKATTALKITRPHGILDEKNPENYFDTGSDRFIENEIEILRNITIREKVAKSLIKTYQQSSAKDSFSLIVNKSFISDKQVSRIKSEPEIAEVILKHNVAIEQKEGLDIVNINVESQSPYEAALIANIYADEYNQLNLQYNRQQLSYIKSFLEDQIKGKQSDLNKSEDSLRIYQQRGRIIALDDQAKSLIDQLTNFEAQKNTADIELIVARKNLEQYKEKLAQQDPRLADYLQSFAAEPYLKSLQEEIAKLETKRDIALSTRGRDKINSKTAISDYDEKISSLKEKVNEKMGIYKAGIFGSSPEEVKSLTQKIIDEETKMHSLSATLQELQSIIHSYDARFNSLPRATIELAKLERNRTANEKMYLLVEQKYQEAIINEQSTPGNVQIINYARIPFMPSKPNKFMILAAGLALGLFLGFGYILFKNYFNIKIQTPEDIEDKNINVLAFIPKIEDFEKNGVRANEFIMALKPNSVISEAYRNLRTSIQFLKSDNNELKTILITSPAPKEGKTITSLNLAGCFAQARKKTLLLDCDIRKPRIHSVFNINRSPGLTDYFYGKVNLSDILRSTGLKNLQIITAGSIPVSPSELLGSNKMHEFLNSMKNEYDTIIIDSAPIIPVTDSNILSRIVDAVIMIVSANKTETDVMLKSVKQLKNSRNNFLGVVLNNFKYKSGYNNYYKYYSYYTVGSGADNKKPSLN